MSNRTLRFLLLVVVVLVAALWLIESGGDSDLPEAGTPLLPDLRAVANDVDEITVQKAGQPPLTIRRTADGWVVPDRGDYPANVDALRALLLAMAEAAVVEAKTANPALHDRLGVGAPSTEDGTAVLVSARTDDNEFAVILGNVAQGSYRYARIADQDQSWLIDQNPDLPDGVAGWLDKDIVDIDSSQVRSVTVSHPDGETISISKSAEADTNFVVADVPDGRQLTYSTVANGIAGALNDLDLDDVRPASGGADGAILATFETFSELRILARTLTDDDGHWLTLVIEHPAGETDDALALRQRVDGWEFRIADYKANLLTRRWEDILEPLPDESADP